MTKLLTPSQKVELVQFILSANGYDEAGKSEETRLLNTIYRIIHPSKTCRHADWEEEAQELLKNMRS